jgi:hypothetical protein
VLTLLVGAAFGVVPHKPLNSQAKSPGKSSVGLVDSIGPRSALKRTIGSFETKWRAMWEEQQFARHGRLDTRDILVDNNARSARTRRYWALTCYMLTPGKQRSSQDRGPVKLKPIVSQPDRGSVCPMWFPPDDIHGDDESEAIDLALAISQRDSARALRAELVTALQKARNQYPGDAWITAQSVRFLFDQADTSGILQAAEQCPDYREFCTRVRAFALSKSGRMESADRAFRQADSMAAQLAPNSDCGFGDRVDIFDVYAQAFLKSLTCEKQDSIAGTAWWLADPMWSSPGNERYVEHSVRRLHLEMRSINSRDERYVWDQYTGSNALHETIVRYGWPSHTYWPGWIYERAMRGQMESVFRDRTKSGGLRVFFPPPSTKEYFPNRTALLPNFAAIRDPFSLVPEHYLLSNPDLSEPDRWWPQEHMWLPYTIAPLDSGQSLMLRRDSSITYQHSIDDPLRKLDSAATGPSRAFLMGGTSANDTRELSSALIARDLTLRLGATLTGKPIVLSTEIHHRTLNEPALRLRMGVHPPPTLRDMRAGDVAMSMPVFLRLPNRSMPLPTEEAEIKRYMAGSTQFSRNEVLAMYWESYGITPGDTVQVDLRIRRIDDRNVLRVIGAMFGVVASHRDSVSIKWTEPDGSRATKLLPAQIPVIARAIAIDINGIVPGEYSALIEMRKGATVVRGERAFVVKEN